MRDWFMVGYDRPPQELRIFGTSDFAVTPGGGDYTEHGVWGLSEDNTLYALDWWHGQTNSDVWIERLADLIVKWNPQCWVGESGVIRRSIEPYMMTRLTQRQALTRVEWVTPIGDKPARQRGFQALASMGKVRFPNRSNWHERVIEQLVKFPAGKYDDATDVCGLAANSIPLLGKPKRKLAPANIGSFSSSYGETGLLG
jgi:predicted phage terminase large subunit-like protein